MELFFGMYEAYRTKEPAHKAIPARRGYPAVPTKKAQTIQDTEWANAPYSSPYDNDLSVLNDGKKTRPTNWQVFQDYSHQDVEIKVVGVWDTVGSLGLPDGRLAQITGANNGFKFHNTSLNSSEHDFLLTRMHF
jgi:hypothetical protein